MYAAGAIDRREDAKGRRIRKVYRILPEGRRRFFAEVVEPLPASRLETTALVRLSFFGLLTPDQRLRVQRLIVAAVRDSLSDLERLERELASTDIPESAREVFFWQTRTLQYGIMSHRAGLAWFQNLPASIEPQ